MTRLLAAVLLAACATTTTTAEPPGSRGPRASEHLVAARDQDELAREQLTSPETRPDATGATPWMRRWDPAKDHERLAQIHRGVAAQLQAEYEEACGERPASEVSVSPLQRYGISGTTIGDGVVIYLAQAAGPPERLLREMRCHRAWMMLAPTDMDDCPLDLAGIVVTAKGDATEIAVTIRSSERSLVGELQRRAAVELETAQRHQTAR